jgi:hypothetical protein
MHHRAIIAPALPIVIPASCGQAIPAGLVMPAQDKMRAGK